MNDARPAWAALAVVALVAPVGVAGQTPRVVVGGVGGYTQTDHVWSRDEETRSVDGLALGGFIDVQTPLSWLSAGAEAVYTQRGSDVILDSGGTPTPGGIRTDYLSFIVRLKAALALGPARLHVAGGAGSDIVLRSRLDPVLSQVLDEEGAAPFTVTAGAGVGAWVTERFVVELEARVVEGLGTAHSGGFVSVRNRSRELVARVGLLLDR